MSKNTNYPSALQKPDSDISVRPVVMHDALHLQQSIWQDRSLETIEEFLNRVSKSNEQHRGLGVVIQHETSSSILAYGQVTYWGTTAEISDLLVHPAHRSCGYGTAMIQYLTRQIYEHGIPSAEIGVAQSNPRALNLYRRLGFQDSYHLELDLGAGVEAVVYLRLYFKDHKL